MLPFKVNSGRKRPRGALAVFASAGEDDDAAAPLHQFPPSASASPAASAALRALGEAAGESGAYLQAAAYFDRALTRGPADVASASALHELKAQALMAAGDDFGAVRAAQTAAAADDSNRHAHHTLGRALLNLGEVAPASAALRRAAALGAEGADVESAGAGALAAAVSRSPGDEVLLRDSARRARAAEAAAARQALDDAAAPGDDGPPTPARSVPFYAQSAGLECGPACVRMVVAGVLGSAVSEARALSAVGLEAGKVSTTLDLAVAIARLVGERSRTCDVRFCSTAPSFNEALMELDFYKKHNASSAAHASALLAEAAKRGVSVIEGLVATGEVLGFLGRRDAYANTHPNRAIIALLDWTAVAPDADRDGNDTAGYWGHFVVVTAAAPSGEDVTFHNPTVSAGAALSGPGQRMPVNVFDHARAAAGTDDDLVFIRW